VAACAGPAKRFAPFRSTPFDSDRDHDDSFSKKRFNASEWLIAYPQDME
jgi:hypothetical protein